MVKSFPYNVVITKSRDVADQLILGNYKAVNNIQERNALIISPTKNNTGFLELDFNYGKSSGQYVTLKFLETSEILEYFLMNDSVEDRLVKEYLDLSIDERKDQEFAGFDVEEIIKRSNKYYISFGIGDNYREWSGPHVCYLRDANLTITQEGIREIELMLVASQSSILADPSFISTKFQGQQDLGDNPKFGITSIGKDKFKCSSDLNLRIPKFTREPERVGTSTWNYYIRKLVTRYLSNLYKVPEGNVLVLFSHSFDVELRPNQPSNTSNGLGDTLGGLPSLLRKYGIDIALSRSVAQQKFTLQLPGIVKQASGIVKNKFAAFRKALPQISSDVYEAVSVGLSKFKELEKLPEQFAVAMRELEESRQVVKDFEQRYKTPVNVDANGKPYFEPIYIGGQDPTTGQGVASEALSMSNKELIAKYNEDRKGNPSLQYANYLIKEQKLERDRRPKTAPSKVVFDEYGKIDLNATVHPRTVKRELLAYTAGMIASSNQDFTFIDLAENRMTSPERTNYKLIEEAKEKRAQTDQSAELSEIIDFESHVLSMACTLHKKSAADIKTIGGFQKPLVTFCDGLNSTSNNEAQQDIQLIEETNLKIKRLLEKFKIIKDSNQPVIIFGEEDLIGSLIYGRHLLSTSNPAFSMFNNDPDRDNNITGRYEMDVYGYYEAIREFLYLSKRQTSSFNEKPDFGVFSNKYKDMIGGKSLIFMNNVKNSNILDVDFSFKGYLSTLLSTPVRSRQRSLAMNIKEEYITEDSSLSLNELSKYIKSTIPKDTTPQKLQLKVIELLYSDDKFIEIVKSKDEFSNVKVVDFLEVLVYLIANQQGKEGVYIESDLGTASKKYSAILKSIKRIQKTLDIKTLPFFNQPSTYLGRECFVFGQQNFIKGSPLRPSSAGEQVEAAYNGNYTINRYRHVISGKECYSEFGLVRDGEQSSKLSITLGKLLGF